MGADKADKDDACVVVNFDDEAVVVPFDIKNDSVAWENVGRWIVGFDRLWIFQSASAASWYQALKACSESACASQKSFRVFLAMMRMID